jgi:hypothetical protein
MTNQLREQRFGDILDFHLVGVRFGVVFHWPCFNVSTIPKVKALNKSHSTEAWGISCCNYIWHCYLFAERTVIKKHLGLYTVEPGYNDIP